MNRTLILVLALVSLAVTFPLAAAGGDPTDTDTDPEATAELIADQEAVGRHPPLSGTGTYEVYDDPEVVSETCASAKEPLECSAEEGAADIQADTDADAASPEQTTPDGSVDASSDWDVAETLDTPETPVDSPMTSDPSTPLDPPVETTETIDMSLGEADVTVRSMERGFNTRQVVDYVGDRTERFSTAMKKIEATHVKVHRLTVLWWDIQCAGAGTWDWSKYDDVVRDAKNRHLRLILNPTGSPNWARQPNRRTPTVIEPKPDPCKPKAGTPATAVWAHPDNLGAWKVFVKQLALRYRQYDTMGYEIWNEENSFAFWDNVGNPDRPPSLYRSPSPKAWTRLYCLAVGEIDANDPGTQVGVGGLVAYRWNGTSTKDHHTWLTRMRASAFMKGAYRSQPATCRGKPFDYVGYHPYIHARYYDGKNPNVGDTPEIVELRYVRGVMRNNHQVLRKIWNTEWGFPSDFRGIDEERQRSLIRREHNYLANAHERFNNRRVYYMRHSILFNAIDGADTSVWSHIGVVRINRQDPGDTKQWEEKLSYAMWASLP